MVFSGNLWSCIKEVKPLAVFHGECGMALEALQGTRASSRVDLGYTELFHVAAVTSVSLKMCYTVLGDSGFQSRKAGLLSCLMWNTEFLCMPCQGIRPHLMARGKSHGFS